MKKTSILVPAAITRNHSAPVRPSGIEPLEARIAPAAIATPATFSYTDADGDIVQVQITGKAGTVEFFDALGGDVHATGGDIAKIVVTKPSPDFAIAFADTNASTGAGIGDNVIKLGTISGPDSTRVPVIKGIFTANSSPSVSYELGGYFGTDFSVGGGLNIVGPVVGDGINVTTDIDLKGLGKLTSISVRGVQAGASVQIAGKVLGNFSTPTLDGDLSLGNVLGRVQIGHIGGSFTVQNDFGGRLAVGDPDPLALPSLEDVTIKGNVLKTAIINATQNLALHVTKNLQGAVNTGGYLEAEVGGAMKGASLLVGGDLTLDVAGIVDTSSIVAQHTVLPGTVFHGGMKSSSIVGGTALNLEVTGSVAKSRFSSGTGSLDVNISGKVSASQLLSGGDAYVVIGFNVDGSSILPDGRLDLSIGTPAQGVIPGVGDVSKSVIGSKSTSALVNIGGKVIGSQFTAGTDLDLTVGKLLATSGIQTSNNLTLDVGTNVQTTRIAVGSDADVTIGGQFAASSLIVSNNLDAQIGQAGLAVARGAGISAGVNKSRLETSDGSMTVNIVGPVAGTVFDSGQHATINIEALTGLDPLTHQLKLLKPGTVSNNVQVIAPADVNFKTTGDGKVAPRIVAGHDAIVNIGGTFGGSLDATNNVTFTAKSVALTAKGGVRVGGDLSFVVDGDVTAPMIDVAGNVKDFRVSGGFKGGINVAGNFVSGTTTAAATVIGGAVSSSSFLLIGGNLGSASTAPEFVFGKGFAGRLEVGGNVLTGLNFQGDVGRISVDGTIGAAGIGGAAATIADIVVKGKLASFNSASLFERTSANGGNFKTADGTTTGVLQADLGAPVVGPFLI